MEIAPSSGPRLFFLLTSAWYVQPHRLHFFFNTPCWTFWLIPLSELYYNLIILPIIVIYISHTFQVDPLIGGSTRIFFRCSMSLRTSKNSEVHSWDHTPAPTKWESLKCVLRGVLIKHGSRLKKEASFKLQKLLSELHDLESFHKSTHLDADLRELTHVSHEILQLMEQKHKCFKQMCSGSFYEWGNKPGKLLARALRDKRASLYIPTIKHSSGSIAHLTEEFLHCFQKYYSSLYNLPAPQQQGVTEAHLSSLEAFLSRTSSPKILTHTLRTLEEAFSVEELHRAISSLPPDKSPGPEGFTSQTLQTFKGGPDNTSSRLLQFNLWCNLSHPPPSYKHMLQ